MKWIQMEIKLTTFHSQLSMFIVVSSGTIMQQRRSSFFNSESAQVKVLSEPFKEFQRLTADGMKLCLKVSILDLAGYKLSGYLDCGLISPILLGIRSCRYTGDSLLKIVIRFFSLAPSLLSAKLGQLIPFKIRLWLNELMAFCNARYYE